MSKKWAGHRSGKVVIRIEETAEPDGTVLLVNGLEVPTRQNAESGYVWAPQLPYVEFESFEALGRALSDLPSSAQPVRLRKNQATLTEAEKQKFVAAVLALKRSGIYDTFVSIHANAVNVLNAHRGPAFLAWHRYFINQFELALQTVDPLVTLPYWDWTVDRSASASLWAPSFLGGDGRASDGQVMDGPFALSGGNWPIRVGTPNYLQRQFGQEPWATTLPTNSDVVSVMGVTPYDSAPWDITPIASFRNQLEGWRGPNIHNRVHGWVGGSMLPMSSPNDPVFFLHHANIDRLWARWQAIHPGLQYVPVSGAPAGHNLNDPMQPWLGPVTPASTIDHRAMGYGYDTEVSELIQLWDSDSKLGMVVYSPFSMSSGYEKVWRNGDMGEGSGAVAWLAADMNGDGHTDMIQMWDNGGSLGMIVYSSLGSGYREVWKSSNMGEGSNAVAWLAADMDGDGRTDVIQLWDNGGSLGMIVYTPLAGIPGYGVAWQARNMGEGSKAVAWLAADMDGDGRTDVVQLWDNGGSLGMIVYSPSGSGYREVWKSSNMSEGSNAVAWLAADMNGDGRTDVVQLWDNGGSLGMIVYSPSSTGSGYEKVWRSSDMGEGSKAVAWLAADMNGDGRTDVVQLWDSGGSLGMIVYSPLGSGYREVWKSSNMGEGSNAVAWLAADMNGDGRTDVVQLWDNGGSLGMIVYTPLAGIPGYGVAWQARNMGEESRALAWLDARQTVSAEYQTTTGTVYSASSDEDDFDWTRVEL